MVPVVLFAVSLSLVAPAHLSHVTIPSFVKLCNRDENNFSECVLDAVQDLFPKLGNGLPELDIPPLDPLFVEESFYEFNTPVYNGKSHVKNAYVHGLSTAKFKNFVAKVDDPDNISLESNVHVEKAVVEGLFKYEGKFMNFLVNGKGPFNITGDDVDIHFKLTGSLYDKEGERYLKIKSFLITPKFGDMHIEAQNLISGNPQMSEIVLNMFNQYWRLGVDIGLPYTQQGWDKVFRPVPNRVFSRVPFDVIFPTSQ